MSKLDDFKKSVAVAVKEVRGKYEPKLSQQRLADKIGKSKQAIVNIECGLNFPGMETLFDIAVATKTNLVISFKTDEQLKAEEQLKHLIGESRRQYQ